MIYFCADDYGLSDESNSRIETCLTDGVLNKISVLPNGELKGLDQHLAAKDVVLSLHINLVEGYPLSEPDDVDAMISKDGSFKYSFIGLFLTSLSLKRKKLEKQLYKEIQSQVRFWQNKVGNDLPICIDSHQHTHMIPLVFKTLMKVIEDENVKVESLRIPAEPVLPYLLTLSYNPKGLLKQCILNTFAIINRRKLKKSKIDYSYFMGVMFSGKLTGKKIKKLLPYYVKIAGKSNKDIEIGFHPGYLEQGERPIDGCRKSFEKFYFSSWRKAEYDTLINFKF